jgi:hypothetical protein
MNTEKYNGYTNRETWTLALNIDNDDSLSYVVIEAVKQIMVQHTSNQVYFVIKYLENFVDQLQEWRFDEASGNINQGLVSILDDIGSTWRIDYNELAHKYIQEYKENTK